MLTLPEPGDSGAWVVQDDKLCGIIISAGHLLPWAFMLPIEHVFASIEHVVDLGPVSIASNDRIIEARYRHDNPHFPPSRGSSQPRRRTRSLNRPKADLPSQNLAQPVFFDPETGFDILRGVWGIHWTEDLVPFFDMDQPTKENLQQDLLPRLLQEIMPTTYLPKSPERLKLTTLNLYESSGYDIVTIENPNLHLVKRGSDLFLKPLPPYLLDNSFVAKHIKPNPELYEASESLLWSYFQLLRHQSDLELAYSRRLLPSRVQLSKWNRLRRSFRGVYRYPAVAGPYYALGEIDVKDLVSSAKLRGLTREADFFFAQYQLNPPQAKIWDWNSRLTSEIYLWALLLLVAVWIFESQIGADETHSSLFAISGFALALIAGVPFLLFISFLWRLWQRLLNPDLESRKQSPASITAIQSVSEKFVMGFASAFGARTSYSHSARARRHAPPQYSISEPGLV